MRGLPPFVHFYNIVAAVTDPEIRLGLIDFLKRPVLSFDVDLVVAEGGDDERTGLLRKSISPRRISGSVTAATIL